MQDYYEKYKSYFTQIDSIIWIIVIIMSNAPFIHKERVGTQINYYLVIQIHSIFIDLWRGQSSIKLL